MLGNKTNLAEWLSTNREAYLLLMEPGNCPPCIHKGLEDLRGLQKAGKHCLVIVVHNWPEEVKGWAQNYDFSPFYVIPQNSFYEAFHVAYLPALLKVQNSRLKNIRYITN